jgi:VWFA-related protein
MKPLSSARTLALIFTSLAAAAQTPTLTVTTRLVVLDVVVTDAQGHPVPGLTAKDFRVLEDGKPQRIVSLEPPAAHTLPANTTATQVFDPAHPAAFGQSPVTILLLDQANTHFADSSFARRELQAYLEKQPALLAQPTTLLDVYDLHFKQLTGFTRDRATLLRALAAAPTEYAWKLEINGRTEDGPLERLDQSLRALEQIAQSYASIPGRKTLVWVGGGFPTVDPTTIDGKEAQEVKDTLQHITNVLLDTRITLYAVDPGSNAAGLTEITDESQTNFISATGGGAAGGNDPFDASDDFNRLGPVTGGRVIRSRNDVAAQIAQSVDLGANFYTLAYAPSSTSSASAAYRKIQVLCLRPGLTATTRQGYYSGTAARSSTESAAAYDLTTASEGTMPLNGLHVTAQPAANGEYHVRVDTANLTWAPADDGTSRASVYVLAVSLDAKQHMLTHLLRGMSATAKAGTNLQEPGRTADFALPVQPAPHAETLRFIVRDSATGRVGSFDLPLGR